MGSPYYLERPNPSMRGVEVQGKVPKLQRTFFIAPNATIVGDVVMGAETAAFYGSVIRSQGQASVAIGDRTVVQDNAKVYGRSQATTIGTGVIIGPNAYVDSCQIGDNVVIGAGAQVNAGAVISSGSYIAPGTVVEAGTQIKGGDSVWVGRPAAALR